MPWVVGIDEAGYGPNLGPLVQAAALARLPADDLAGWDHFNEKIRRAHDRADQRLLVDDSKKVYRGGVGFDDLQATLAGWCHIFGCCVLESRADHDAEFWHDWDCIDKPLDPCPICDAGVIPHAINVVVPRRLNRLIDETGTKATALLQGTIGLVQSLFEHWRPDESVVIVADKHGGRHYYAALLQEAFPDGWVVAEREVPEESRYRILNLPFELTVIFRPKADAASVSVALASMMAKYFRELCMRDYNAFWARHVPGLKPTAGYPLDAKRFYREIEPAMHALGIPKDAVWRNK